MVKTSAHKSRLLVRQKIIRELLALGWSENRLRWKPEWPVPNAPDDLIKRERGQKYTTCGSADLVAFADESNEWFVLQVIFDFRAPDLQAGRAQLIHYLDNEPMARMGFWTNGVQTLAVYRQHQSGWVFDENAGLPLPTDNLTQSPDEPSTWRTMRHLFSVTVDGYSDIAQRHRKISDIAQRH